jgi:hypothetical protein
MSRTMRAWRKANRYVRTGQHERAIYWLLRTQQILEAGPPRSSRFKQVDIGYAAAAVFLVALLWAAHYG